MNTLLYTKLGYKELIKKIFSYIVGVITWRAQKMHCGHKFTRLRIGQNCGAVWVAIEIHCLMRDAFARPQAST